MNLWQKVKEKFNRKGEIRNILVIGIEQSGKTTTTQVLLNRLTTDINNPEFETVPTKGVHHEQFRLKNGTVFNITDIGGQEHYRHLWMENLDETECVIFIIDAFDGWDEGSQSFPLTKEKRDGDAEERWYGRETEHSRDWNTARKELEKVSNHLKELEKNGHNIPFIICANKIDLIPKDKLNEMEMTLHKFLSLKEFAQHHASWDFIRMSAKSGDGILPLFESMYLRTNKKENNYIPMEFLLYKEGGIPVIAESNMAIDDQTLISPFFEAISDVIKLYMKDNLKVIEMEKRVVIFHREEGITGVLAASILSDRNMCRNLLEKLVEGALSIDYNDVKQYSDYYYENVIPSLNKQD